MSDQEFVTYQKFNSTDELKVIAELLNENGIGFLLEDESMSFDSSFANNQVSKEYRIKLKKEDFELADQLQDQFSDSALDEIPQDYYLFSFTNEELIDVLSKRDEWSHFDFMLARKILKSRGIEMSPEQLDEMKEERVKELSKPEENQSGKIIAGYIFAFLGGFIGCFIGWHLNTHKKTLPNGERVYGYSEHDRRHGRQILFIGILFTLIWLTVRILMKPR